MKSDPTAAAPSGLPAPRVADDYLDLIRAFPLRKLRTAAEHQEAARLYSRIGGRPGGKITPGERDYLGALGQLIKEYDDRTRAAPPEAVAPLEALRYLMKEHGMNTNDLGRVLGSQATASLILNGNREPSTAHVRKLAKRFNVGGSVFL